MTSHDNDHFVSREESVRRAEEMFKCLDVDCSGELTEVRAKKSWKRSNRIYNPHKAP